MFSAIFSGIDSNFPHIYITPNDKCKGIKQSKYFGKIFIKKKLIDRF